MTDKEKIENVCVDLQISLAKMRKDLYEFPTGTSLEVLYQILLSQLDQTRSLIFVIEQANK
jgi:hypothetical protein